MRIDRPKLLAVLSFLFSLPAGYYFMQKDILQAAVYLLLSDVSDRMASKIQAREKSSGWKMPLKIAIERCSDAAIFVGFLFSGAVPVNYGAALLAAAIIVPFWARAVWKKNVRWVFHAMIYLYAILAYL